VIRPGGLLVALLLILLPSGVTAGGRQLGALASPGPLSRPHADLEGIRRCQSCHEPGKGVSAERCLRCHAPISRRIAAKRGVHRSVTTDCVACHVEHMGIDAELRPFETRGFDHARETGYALDGRHARLAANCASCHKTRSFLTASPACASCHRDPHKGSLGARCERCHRTADAFEAATRTFDHSVTSFPLAGAHGRAACAACHTGPAYTGLEAATCASCHKDPHATRFGPRCESCHTSDSWRTTRVDHSRTSYPLVARHASVPCAKCHVRPALRVKPPSDRCASCHRDPHAGAFREDCRACHSETGFAKAPFDHAATTFPLTGAHQAVRCAACHKAAGRLGTTCASCHEDVHEGALGIACESCHTTATFRLATYTHRGAPAFYEGQHAGIACARCHVPELPAEPVRTGRALHVRYAGTPTACASCHADVHLGQVGASCESCHSIQAAKFALAGFSHDRTRFPLEGRHRAVECRQCHLSSTGTFPSGHGTAVRLTALDRACAACHADVHQGQLGTSCEGCHSQAAFRIERYTHRSRSLGWFFTGAHAGARCEQCHPATSTPNATGRPVVRYRVDSRCTACHTDVHRGQLGDRCGDCHRLGGRS
jgi:hypothetical protein